MEISLLQGLLFLIMNLLIKSEIKVGIIHIPNNNHKKYHKMNQQNLFKKI